MFNLNNIPFNYDIKLKNEGFDKNIFNCYIKARTDYIWIISDDDNIYDESIDKIFNDIIKYKPNLIFYNFLQKPYLPGNPLIKNNEFLENLSEININSLNYIIKFPKLTSLVYKKDVALVNKIQKLLNFNGFLHVGIALETAISNGKIFYSNFFIGSPDHDYLDHIDFVPFIGNYLNEMVEYILCANNLNKHITNFNLKHTDPLESSLEWIYLYYRGSFQLSLNLKDILFSTIKTKFKLSNINFKVLKLLFKISVFNIFYNFKKINIQIFKYELPYNKKQSI